MLGERLTFVIRPSRSIGIRHVKGDGPSPIHRSSDRITPWEGHFAGYIMVDGKRVPSKGEVGWYIAGKWRSVWEGTVTDLRYESTR